MLKHESVALFTYGSLMFSEVWQKVTNLDTVPVPGRLHEHVRCQVAGEDYPAVLERSGAAVDGALYTGLSPRSMALLDRFEGPDYERVPVTVVLSDKARADPVVFAPAHWPLAGREVAAYVYLFRGDGARDGHDWSVSDFKLAGMARFIDAYIGFRREG